MAGIGGMTEALLWVGFALGSLWCFRWMFRVVVIAPTWRSVDWLDVSSVLLFAALVAPFWPLVAAVLLLRNTIGRGDPQAFADRVGGRPRADRSERGIAARDARIAELERQLL